MFCVTQFLWGATIVKALMRADDDGEAVSFYLIVVAANARVIVVLI